MIDQSFDEVPNYEIYVNGACNQLTKQGAYGFSLWVNGTLDMVQCEKIDGDTTCNRAQMIGLVKSVEQLSQGNTAIIFTNNMVAINALLGNTNNPSNIDLIEEFEKSTTFNVVRLEFIGNKQYNERMYALRNYVNATLKGEDKSFRIDSETREREINVNIKKQALKNSLSEFMLANSLEIHNNNGIISFVSTDCSLDFCTPIIKYDMMDYAIPF